MGFYDRKLAQRQQAPQEPRLPAPAITPQQTHVVTGPPEVSDVVRMTANGQNQSGRCPNCNSGNYVGPSLRYQGGDNSSVTTEHGMVSASARCFDCGFNPKLGSLLTGLGTPAIGQATIGTKQTAEGGMMKHNFHPKDTSAGRIG